MPDEATKQKTMTKVQNDVNEIIGKDYDYVLSNLGEPNSTTYWIDKDNIDNLKTLRCIEDFSRCKFGLFTRMYQMEESTNSALYLKLKDKVVKKAQNVDYSRSEYLIENFGQI